MTKFNKILESWPNILEIGEPLDSASSIGLFTNNGIYSSYNVFVEPFHYFSSSGIKSSKT